MWSTVLLLIGIAIIMVATVTSIAFIYAVMLLRKLIKKENENQDTIKSK